MFKVKSVIALLALAVGASAYAGSSSSEQATQLNKVIAERTAQLGELQVALRAATQAGKTATIKLSIDGAKTLIVGYGTARLVYLERIGNGPFSRMLARLRDVNPRDGILLGPLPRAAARQAAIFTTQMAALSTMVSGAVWSVVEAVAATKDAVYLTIDITAITGLEAQIQYAQEKLSTAAGDLNAVLKTIE